MEKELKCDVAFKKSVADFKRKVEDRHWQLNKEVPIGLQQIFDSRIEYHSTFPTTEDELNDFVEKYLEQARKYKENS